MSNVLTGKVKFYNKSKGYGFIIDDETGKDVFFHIKDSNDPHYNTDDNVMYELGETKKGISATDVKILK